MARHSDDSYTDDGLADFVARLEADCDGELRRAGINLDDPSTSPITADELKWLQRRLEDARAYTDHGAPGPKGKAWALVSAVATAAGFALTVSGPVGWTVLSIGGAVVTTVGGTATVVQTIDMVNKENNAMMRLRALDRAADVVEMLLQSDWNPGDRQRRAEP